MTGCLQGLTRQFDSAIDNFSQSLDMGIDDVTAALSGKALNCFEKGMLEQAKDTFLEYLKLAPRCDKGLAKNCYFLASLSLSFSQTNWQDFSYYYEQGIEAEMDRLPFLAALIVQAKRTLFGLYLISDTSKMSFCNKCFRVEAQTLVLHCQSCHEVIVVCRQDGDHALKRILTVLSNKHQRQQPNTLRPSVRLSVTYGESYSHWRQFNRSLLG